MRSDDYDDEEDKDEEREDEREGSGYKRREAVGGRRWEATEKVEVKHECQSASKPTSQPETTHSHPQLHRKANQLTQQGNPTHRSKGLDWHNI